MLGEIALEAMSMRKVVGIDEAGRGPLAGPLSVGLVLIKKRRQLDLSGLRDSKKLTEINREEWFLKIKDWEKRDLITSAHMFVSSKIIDKKGLAYASKYAVKKLLDKALINPKDVRVLLDAGLYAPKEFLQKSIVKGDEKISEISLASIIAKVKRDRFMIRISRKYPIYEFDVHKGYGTKKHISIIQREGISDLHRNRFLKNIKFK